MVINMDIKLNDSIVIAKDRVNDLNSLLTDILVANKIRKNYTPNSGDMNKLQGFIEEIENRIGDIMANICISVTDVESVKLLDS